MPGLLCIQSDARSFFFKVSFPTKNSFWTDSRRGEGMGQFATDPINKAIQCFTKTEYIKDVVEHFEHSRNSKKIP